MEKRFKVDGMFCTACTKSVEKAMSKIEGVESYSVNLMSGVLLVNINDRAVNIDRKIISAVKKLGFKIHSLDEKNSNIILVVSVILTLILFYISMYEMFNFPLPNLFNKNNPICYLSILFSLSSIIIILNFSFFIKGYKAIINLSPTMDSLVSLGSTASYILGAISFIKVIVYFSNNNLDLINIELKTIYFDSASMVLVFVSIGKYLESKAKYKTTEAINKLKKIMPKFATILNGGKEVNIDCKDVNRGDTVVIKLGNIIPVDGIIISGKGDIDESSITGESFQVTKTCGDEVLAGTLLTSGYLEIEAIKVGEKTKLGEIVSLVENATLTKAPIQRIADKISSVFVPTVFCLSLLTFIIWILISKDFDKSIKFAISVLVISCPCSLGLATPVAITTIIGRLSQDGIMVKDAKSIEDLSKIKVLAFDKTGTITYGNIKVVSIDKFSKDDLIAIKSIESKSSHLIGSSITKYLNEFEIKDINNFSEELGLGVMGEVDGKLYKIGNSKFIGINEEINSNINNLTSDIFVSIDGNYIGKISLADEIRPSSYEFIASLKNLNIKPVLISGDNKVIVDDVSKKLAIDSYYDSVSPIGKKDIINDLKKQGLVSYFGDGINDSLALITSDIGISIKGSSDIAISSGSIILLNDNLLDIIKAYRYSQRAYRIIKENLFWALIYNVLMIPLAAGCFSFLGLSLSPVICSICMSLSSIFVCLNALRLKKKIN